ncbi:pyridoxamine 5'-phosphate oxidase family protein [Frankia sp. AgKG'84/4]|uniref:pyridoxamine 5'-phosphate oxidase family protein n=1 Tax=Frankia sp. AgKG'84/4 TaxID=573490 RepID=UPI00202A8C47|nr:pyridoxamine 5'-phosphate oxidase family protein [Frankia sp. AgKG'84/4]MCL9794562.1 pyridoxamine 5'-phosphate oxidase family protein [Frankia sp. AgKG'84/4]
MSLLMRHDGAVTTSWHDFETAQPAFAETVTTRFAAFRHHVLATLRADGAPRTSGIETNFKLGELWLGSMPGARKADDLRRDPRFALSANPGPGTGMGGGDVRIAGFARWVDDPATMARFADAVSPPEPFDLFRVELTEVVRTTVDEAAGEIILTTWRPGHPALRVQRRS